MIHTDFFSGDLLDESPSLSVTGVLSGSSSPKSSLCSLSFYSVRFSCISANFLTHFSYSHCDGEAVGKSGCEYVDFTPGDPSDMVCQYLAPVCLMDSSQPRVLRSSSLFLREICRKI
jgi:hypothetical protein